jgi:hypothetical protein
LAIDENIVNTVNEIFKAVTELNSLRDIFDDLTKRLIEDLHANSFMEFNLELKEEQKEQLHRAVSIRGNETVRNYLANINKDKRVKNIYDICKEKTTGIVDAVLSSIGQVINRGAIINAVAVQANAKNEDYDEIILRKSKHSGDITIPTNCILISTNCVSVIKSSCQQEKKVEEEKEEEVVDEAELTEVVKEVVEIAKKEEVKREGKKRGRKPHDKITKS